MNHPRLCMQFDCGGKYDYDFWNLVIRCSIIFSGVVRMGVTGPNVFSISLRFWVSVLLMAPVSGAATV